MSLTPDEKVREARLRRMARRQGLTLSRNPRRDPRAVDYGQYTLVLPDNGLALGGEFGVSLDEIERYLNGERSQL